MLSGIWRANHYVVSSLTLVTTFKATRNLISNCSALPRQVRQTCDSPGRIPRCFERYGLFGLGKRSGRHRRVRYVVPKTYTSTAASSPSQSSSWSSSLTLELGGGGGGADSSTESRPGLWSLRRYGGEDHTPSAWRGIPEGLTRALDQSLSLSVDTLLCLSLPRRAKR